MVRLACTKSGLSQRNPKDSIGLVAPVSPGRNYIAYDALTAYGVPRREPFWEFTKGTLSCAVCSLCLLTHFRSRFSKPDNGIRVTCCRRVDGGDHQLWDLERATRTTAEIKSILKSWKPDILSRLFQPHDDKNECVPAIVRFREQSSPMINSK